MRDFLSVEVVGAVPLPFARRHPALPLVVGEERQTKEEQDGENNKGSHLWR